MIAVQDTSMPAQPSSRYTPTDQAVQNFNPPYIDQRQQSSCPHDFHAREGEYASPPQMESLLPGAKRQTKGKKAPSAASLAQKKYMERQKVADGPYTQLQRNPHKTLSGFSGKMNTHWEAAEVWLEQQLETFVLAPPVEITLSLKRGCQEAEGDIFGVF